MLENLKNIRVVYEIVAPEPGHGFSKEVTYISSDGIKPTQKDIVDDLIKTTSNIVDISVQYEEIGGEIYKSIQETLKEFEEFEVLFINGNPPIFIPVDDKANVNDQENVNIDSADKNVPTSMLDEIELEIQSENHSNVNASDSDQSQDPDLPKWMLDMISNETLYDNKVEHNNEINDNQNLDLPLWLMDEIDADKHRFSEKSKSIEMEGPEWLAKEASMMQKITSYFEKLPRESEVNEEINETLQLLDDIKLFGDEREIPLLQELLEKEDKQETKTRIDALMKRFMGADVYSALPVLTAPYSVFEELFRNCDTESKLILLNEIVEVGNYKEVYFLEKLCSDPNASIRKKALKCLVPLKKKCAESLAVLKKEDDEAYNQLLKGMELDPPKDSSLFNVEFGFWDTDASTNPSPKNDVLVESKIITFISNIIKKLPF